MNLFPQFKGKNCSEVKLYHLDKKEWVKVTVDEFVPCMSQNGMLEPACARPLGEEIWVPLLEKAIAKLLGDLKKTVEDLFFFFCENQRISLKGPFGGLSDAWTDSDTVRTSGCLGLWEATASFTAAWNAGSSTS